MAPRVIDPAIGCSSPRQQPQQRGLARAVGTDQRHLAPSLEHEADVTEHDLAVIPGVDIFEFGNDARATSGGGEREARDQLLALGNDDAIELLERLDPTLHLTRFGGLVAKPLDEPLDVLHFACLARRGCPLLFETLFAQRDELGEAADVFGERFVGQLEHSLRDRVDEIAIVAHEENRTGPVLEMAFEPRHAVDIEMVGGLVEQQYVGFGEQEPSQRHPHAPTTGQLAHRPLGITGSEAETREHTLRPGFERIAAELLVTAVLVAVDRQGTIADRRVVRRHLMLELVDAVGERIEMLRPRHRRLEDGALRCLGKILRQVPDAEVSRPMDLARVGRMDAREDLEQRGLAGAVAAHERGSTAQWQRDRHVAKEHARAMCFAKTRCRQHGRRDYRRYAPFPSGERVFEGGA